MEEIKPSNHGKLWTNTLELELMEYVEKGYSTDNLAKMFERTNISIELTVRRIKIDTFIKQRKIEKLIHFTDLRNLSSIKKHGILPVKTLKEKGIRYYYNDENRYDAQLGGVSVSITSRNDYLLRTFQKRNARRWVEIEINCQVAARRNCLFYDSNAASLKFEGMCEDDLSSYDALTHMFSESVETTKRVIKRRNKKLNETTDNQAEIIVKWMIPKTQILSWKEINV